MVVEQLCVLLLLLPASSATTVGRDQWPQGMHTVTAGEPNATAVARTAHDKGSRSSCWSLISSSGELNASGANVLGQCAGHSAADRSFTCGGVANYLEMRNYLGVEDFKLQVELMLKVVNGTAASVMFLSAAGDHFDTKGDHVGLDGAVGPNKSDVVFLEGPHFGFQTESTAAPAVDRWFQLELTRVGGQLTGSLNGSKIFSVPMKFAVEGIALRPWRSTMHIRGLGICAPQLPAPGGPSPPPPPPHGLVTVFSPGEAGIPIYRIPALCAAGPALVAFIEGRERQGGDFAIKRVMTKRSLDRGETWSPVEVVAGTWARGQVVGQPTCAYDPVRKQLVLQYQNSTKHSQVNGATLQVTSKDYGVTWSAPELLDPFLGDFKGVFPGPGTALVLSNKSKKPGRYVFPAWGVRGSSIYDMVSYSDDGGQTYRLSDTHWPANLSGVFEEPTVAETQSGDVLINMRMANDQQQCGGIHCRFGARSTDGGESFSVAKPIPSLVSSGCQGSLLFHPPSNAILFSNPRNSHNRINGTLTRSLDNGASWEVCSTIDPRSFGYSCLSLLPVAVGPESRRSVVNSTHVGVLYEGPAGLLLFTHVAIKSDDTAPSDAQSAV